MMAGMNSAFNLIDTAFNKESTMNDFAGQVAIVTGAGQGIGFEICRQLATRGAAVILNDYDGTLATRAAERINSAGGKCLAAPGDAADISFIHQLILTAHNEFGRLDIAIANAGITLFGDFFNYKPEALQKVMNLNLAGSFFLTQAAAIEMKKHGEGGSILLMSSVTAHQAHKDLAAYGMTKAALEMLAKTLVVELSPYKISINAIAPGATKTERTVEDKDYEKTWSRITPMGRPANVNDIAQAALFLVSGAARHITGQSLVVDGGWSAVSPSPY
jgi:3-oxoacyl-[acyl-carrier protein] reductase